MYINQQNKFYIFVWYTETYQSDFIQIFRDSFLMIFEKDQLKIRYWVGAVK